jgi:hypothetical protein
VVIESVARNPIDGGVAQVVRAVES